MCETRRSAPRQLLAEREEQGGSQHQPGKHPHERVRGSFQEKECTQQPADDAGHHQWHHHPSRQIETVSVGAAAGGGPDP